MELTGKNIIMVRLTKGRTNGYLIRDADYLQKPKRHRDVQVKIEGGEKCFFDTEEYCIFIGISERL